MAVVLFVHGTGGRKPAYDQTFAVIGEALRTNRIDLKLERCLWGDTLGSSEPRKAIPGFTPAADDGSDDDRRWAELAADPFIEVRLIAAGPPDPSPPGGVAAAQAKAQAVADRVLSYSLGGEPLATVSGWGLADLWPRVWEAFVERADLVRGCFVARNGVGEPGRAVVRALTASLLLLAADEGRALPTRAQRNAFVPVLAAHMELLTAGVRDSIKSFFNTTILPKLANAAMPEAIKQRGQFSLKNGLFAGDVLLYQARGVGIRNYIRARVEEARSDVYLLAHSLGGIACVDLLVRKDRPAAVRGLITVGSQAALFAEFGALSSLDPGVTALPESFPQWLNIYDERDFLSYLAAPVFGAKAVDRRVDSEQPFPLSHGAYWTNPQTWTLIADFVTC